MPIARLLITLSLSSLLVLAGCRSQDNTTEEAREVAHAQADAEETGPAHGQEQAREQQLDLIEEESWQSLMGKYRASGTFVLTQLRSSKAKVFNPTRAEQRFSPASTFKVFNTMVALDEGAVADEHEVIRWDQVERMFNKWNQDLTLVSAFEHSAFWVYQETARRVGPERMQFWLDEVQYGNRTMSEEVDMFWLDRSLKISAVEQVRFLETLVTGELPFSASAQAKTKSIMVVEQGGGYALYAKTGMTEEPHLGWYVGFVEADETWMFALNLDLSDFRDRNDRQDITKSILRHEGVLPAEDG